MKKHILLSVAALCALNSYAGAETLEEKVNRLEKELQSLHASQKEIATSATFAETKAYSNKLNWSPELRLRTDSFSYKNDGITGYSSTSAAQYARESGYEKDFQPATNIRLRLNMDYKADDDTKFVGRIGIYRNSQTSERICTLHAAMGTSSATTTAFEIDKAYVDKTFDAKGNLPYTLTFGILPTSGGSSTNLAENKPRQSMFPSLMFDMNTYGVIGTLNTEKYIDNSALRVVYAKAYTLNKDAFYYQCNREIVKNADIAGIFYEQSIAGLGDNTFMIGINRLGHIMATPFIGSPTILDTDKPSDLGSIVNYGAHLELRNVANSNTDAFAGIAFSTTDPSGTSANYKSTAVIGSTLGSSGLDYAYGQMYTQSGWATHVGAIYNAKSIRTKFGAEFNHGSQYWFSGTQGAEDPFNKLAVRGNAYEVYAIHNLTKNLFFKAGYLLMQEKYTGSGWHFGTAYKKDATTSNAYVMLNASF